MFTPRKLDPVALGGPGRLWGYLQGGHQYADYYLARDGTPTKAQVELHGKLFARLGLDQLDRRAFERLAAGCHPLTGQRLVKPSHARCRDRATGELVTRGGAQVQTPGELAVASFTHHTSRPSPEVANEPDRPPDPQLHSHVFVFNLAWCEPRPGQGRFLAVDSRPIFQFGQTAEAIYSCELAAQLQRLGYQLDWHQTRRGRVWELAGVDERLMELFSSRHRHIDHLAARFQQEKGRPPTKLEGCRSFAGTGVSCEVGGSEGVG